MLSMPIGFEALRHCCGATVKPTMAAAGKTSMFSALPPMRKRSKGGFSPMAATSRRIDGRGALT
jgi:hypothetical protein